MGIPRRGLFLRETHSSERLILGETHSRGDAFLGETHSPERLFPRRDVYLGETHFSERLIPRRDSFLGENYSSEIMSVPVVLLMVCLQGIFCQVQDVQVPRAHQIPASTLPLARRHPVLRIRQKKLEKQEMPIEESEEVNEGADELVARIKKRFKPLDYFKSNKTKDEIELPLTPTVEYIENSIGQDDIPRSERTLINSFPFPDNSRGNHRHGNHHGNHHGSHHEQHHGSHHGEDQRFRDGQKYGSAYGDYEGLSENNVEIVDTKKFELLAQFVDEGANHTVEPDGKKCIKKVMMVEETEYDEVLTCDHSYDNRCHTSYVTKYEPHQEEDCEEKFKKTCYIDYEQKAYAETVQVCITPWVKDCSENVSAPQFCQTVYQSECFTKQTVHEVEDDVAVCNTVEEQKCQNVTSGYTTELKCDKWPREVCSLTKQKVKKYTPDTSCEKVPKEMCRPRGCGIKEGPVQCRDKVKTVIVDNPVEECDMEPIRTCKHVTKLVPRLVASQECVEVPKEICARSKINPRRVQKPAVQKWCYTIEDYSSTTEPPVLESACQDDTSCAPGYICEQGECKARPGKVLLNSITIRTEDCTDCTQEGVILTLFGERVIGLPEGVPCTTELLDHTDTRDFQKGQTAVWDESSPTQLGGCYEAPLNAMLRDGGKLEWKGTGIWTPQSVCVDWKSTNSVYQCLVVPVPSSNSTDTEENAPVTPWSLMNCEDLFPKQSCSEEEK